MSVYDRKAFGEILRDARRTNGVKIRTITKHMGWSKTYLMDIETGKRNPPKGMDIIKLCRCIGVEDVSLMLRLALKARSKFYLYLSPDDSYEKRNCAYLLIREWGSLENETLEEIARVIEGLEA